MHKKKKNNPPKKSLLEIAHSMPPALELTHGFSFDSDSKVKLYNNRLFEQCLDEIPDDQKAAFELNYAVAAKLDAILKEVGMTPHELSQKLGKTDKTVAEWLAGRFDFTLSVIANIEVALGHKLIYLDDKEI